MKTLVIVAHPNIEQSTINKTWLQALEQNAPDITVHNIYTSYPDWNIDVAAEQSLLEQHDRIIFQTPIYWFSIPPLLKKWFDDVFAYGWAYGSTGNKLTHKKMGIVVSTGGNESAYTVGNNGEIQAFLTPMMASIKFVKADYDSYHVFHGALSENVQKRLEDDIPSYLTFVTQG